MARVPVQHLNLHIRPHFPHKVGVLAWIACWRACLRNVRHTAVPYGDKAVDKSGPPCSDKDAVKSRFTPGLSFRPLRSPSAEGILSNPFVEVWAPPGRIRTAGACCKHQQPNVTASLVTSAPADIFRAPRLKAALLSTSCGTAAPNSKSRSLRTVGEECTCLGSTDNVKPWLWIGLYTMLQGCASNASGEGSAQTTPLPPPPGLP